MRSQPFDTFLGSTNLGADRQGGADERRPELPDFSAMVADAKHRNPVFRIQSSEETESTRQRFRLFRDLLRSKPFELNSMLLEVAAIADQRELRAERFHDRNGDGSFFASYLISYLESSDSELLLKAWDQAIETLTQRYEKAIIPDPNVYRYVFHCLPLQEIAPDAYRRWPRFLNSPGLSGWPSEPTGGADASASDATSPRTLAELNRFGAHEGVTVARRYEFRAQRASTDDEMQRTIEKLARDTLYFLLVPPHTTTQLDDPQRTRILQYLAASRMIVVPFRRRIEFPYAQERDKQQDHRLGGEPGGCLFAVLSSTKGDLPSCQRPCASSCDSCEECIFARAAGRLSWLLHQAALLETDAKTATTHQLLDANKLLLRKIGHSIVGPLDSGVGAFSEVCASLEAGAVSATMRDKLRTARGSLRQAQMAARCINYLVRLDPATSTPEQREAIARGLRDGHTSLMDVINDVRSDYTPSNSAASVADVIRLICPEGREHYRVDGSRDAWTLVFQLVLKNATEAAKHATDKTVQVALDYDDRRKMVRITVANHVGTPLAETKVTMLNHALGGTLPNGERNLPSDETKPDSQGLGVVTVGEFVRCFGGRASFTVDGDQVTLHIERIRFDAPT